MKLTLPLLLLATACAQRALAPPVPPPPRPPPAPPLQEVPRRRSTGPLTQAERDSLLREVAARREAWRARHISDYQIEIAVGCFCPWPKHPAILEVRGGVIVALRDTTGKSIGKPREPWSLYTVEGLFDAWSVRRLVLGHGEPADAVSLATPQIFIRRVSGIR